MINNAKLETEIKAFLKTYWDTYFKGDLTQWATFLTDDYKNIGTTKEEIWNSKKEILDYSQEVIDQMVGNAEIRNKEVQVFPYDPYIMAHEIGELYVKADEEWMYYAPIRLSSFLQKNGNGWQVLHQHGSFPDSKTSDGEAFGFDELKVENEKLQIAVKERSIELENRNRELEIEAALERVRSRSLAMYKSDELNEVVAILFEKLKELQIPATAVGIAIPIDGSKDFNAFVCGENEAGLVLTNYRLPFFENIIAKELYYALDKQLDLFIGKYSKEEKNAFYGYLFEHSAIRNVPDDIKSMIFESPSYTITMVAVKNALFNINDFEGKLLSENEIDIIKRFSKVFDHAYIRFLDLQKAEAQVREANIEGALERVRSKAMSMRSSEDIGEATTVLFKEIEKLEIETMRCGILIIHENKVMDVWTTSTTKNDKIVSVSGQINMTIHPLLEGVFDGWKKGVSHTQYKLEGKDGGNYYKAISQQLSYKLPVTSVTRGRHFNTCFMFNEGALFAFTKNEISDSAGKIYERFAKVFGLTYQRYRELIESEKREKEANKQSSLDRVRGEIASMRSTEDLNRITPIIWQELTNLGVPFFRCGVFIMNEKKENIQVYLSDSNGKSLGLMNLEFTTSDLTKNSLKAWRNKEVYKTHWNREEFTTWTTSLKELGKIETQEGYQGGDEGPESLDLHFVPFTQGMLYVGNLEPLDEEQIDLVRNLSESFSIAYSRYEDFTKLEKAKESVEVALINLQATQKQLIQSEKMASLGELTAGIAHEIQNPLNFVNNFSEVSNELIDEMNEEIENGDLEEAKLIANDIKQNLEKINHHGKRADAIVKGMLQHSRKSSAEKEPTDINKLADEYLRLAYHGLRAKDKSFNATLETDFDESIGMVNVIPQDIGRVILNLITNAFYAVNEKLKANGSQLKAPSNKYQPTVTVSTKKLSDTILISVKDNGYGIAKHVVDKIFQPFFTTKPTGEGTGLGLSMSYDIVTKGHGGELKVNTKEGEGTKFSIILTLENSK